MQITDKPKSTKELCLGEKQSKNIKSTLYFNLNRHFEIKPSKIKKPFIETQCSKERLKDNATMLKLFICYILKLIEIKGS